MDDVEQRSEHFFYNLAAQTNKRTIFPHKKSIQEPVDHWTIKKLTIIISKDTL